MSTSASSSSSSGPIIYKSLLPDIDLRYTSIYSYIFQNEPLDDFPATIDAVSGITLTRAQLYDQSLRVAYGIQKRGLKRGDAALIFCPNTLAWSFVFPGIIAAGVRATFANSSYLTSELAHQYQDCKAGLIFVHPTLLSTLEKTLKSLNLSTREIRSKVVIMSFTPQDEAAEVKVGLGKEWTRLKDFLKEGKLAVEEKFEGGASHDTSLLCYSSGTTGISKAVENSHHNIVTALELFQSTFPKTDYRKDVSGAVLPFYHIYGSVLILLYGLRARVPTVVLPHFEPELFLNTIQKYRITVFMIVPPIVLFLATHPLVDRYDLSTLRHIQCGAAPLGPGLAQKFLDRLHARGAKNVPLTQAYGLTETSTTTHLLPVPWSAKKVGSCGWLLPNMEARIIDEDEKDVIRPRDEDNPFFNGGKKTARTLAENSDGRGEIWVRGPLLMKGYLNNPAATANAFSEDGWLKTGDVGIKDDDGFYYIVDRKKELIKYKGFQVPPAELEAVLLTKDDILDVGVIGVRLTEDDSTELPRAYIVSKRNGELLKSKAAQKAYEVEVQEWIIPRVAKHKWLRGGVVIVDSIPKSLSGKILRRQLRELAKKEDEVKAKL